MNSPDFDTQLDHLFREALQPQRQVAPPPGVWQRIERALSSVTLDQAVGQGSLRTLGRRVGLSIGEGFRPLSGRLLTWSRLVSLVQGLEALSPLPLSPLMVLEPEFRFAPSPFVVVPTKQILDLRLVFSDLGLNFN